MAYRASPFNQWEDLRAWLDVMTGDFLPSFANQLQSPGPDQMNQYIAEFMATPHKQKYWHKELTKLLDFLAHNLLARL